MLPTYGLMAASTIIFLFMVFLGIGSVLFNREVRRKHYEALEREHFGDPDKRTGIYAPREKWYVSRDVLPEPGQEVIVRVEMPVRFDATNDIPRFRDLHSDTWIAGPKIEWRALHPSEKQS